MISRPRLRTALLAPLLAFLMHGSAAAADGNPPASPVAPVDGDTRLASCLEQARIDPPAARAKAEKWLGESGDSAPARLCQAMALFHDHAFADAAERLEALAAERAGDDPRGAGDLLSQAGWAWLRAGDANKADSAYTRAMAGRPDDPDLWIDRAFARAESERYWDAIDDLNHAVALAPDRFEPYLYRAAAHQALSQPKSALDDVAIALEKHPDDPRAVLLRGNIKGESGDLAGAEADWTLVLRLDDGDGPSARAARINLDRLKATRE